MVVLFKEGLVIASLYLGFVSSPCSSAGKRLRLVAAYGLGSAGGTLAFPGEEADGRPYVPA